ncbi:hypothetical protein ACHQM5_002814 [Ranunculus cassubicifolius]
MDLKVKGISWVGNVYQKFETMCLEVEDVVCQETAKYVETQVKTVGSSVKKFYSEVLQDLLPPSPKGSERSLEQNDAFGTYEKPNLSHDDISAKEDSDTRATSAKSSCQDQKFEIDICKKPKTVAEKYPINKRLLPAEVSDVISSSRENVSQVSLRSRLQKKTHPSSVDPVVAIHSKLPIETNSNESSLPPPELLESVDPEGDGVSSCSPPEADLAKAYSKETKNASSTSYNSRKADETSCSNRVVEISRVDCQCACQSSSALPAGPCENKVVENEISSFKDESNVADTRAFSNALPLMEPSWITPEQSSEWLDDNDHLRLDDGDDIVELTPELLHEFHNAKLEDSCIVVDTTQLPSVPHEAPKHRSYKKKIRDALASRMRLANRQEYEQLAVWHEDSDYNSPKTESSSSSTLVIKGLTKSQSKDNGESEWELL